MKIILLGTGTPAPSLVRQSSGILIEVGDDSIVMDHGPGAYHRLMESGRSATAVTYAFFTHVHYDHCMDFPRLVMQRWDAGAGKIPELNVYGPPPVMRMSEQLFGEEGVFGPDIKARVSHRASLDIYEARGGVLPRQRPAPIVRELDPGNVIEGKDWRITVGRASHMQPYLTCYGYRLDSPEGTVCYSGDNGGVQPDMIELARGTDVLIHMMHYRAGTERSEAYRQACGSHLDVARTAREAGVGKLVLTHMSPPIDRPGVRERIIAEMSRVYEGAIIWGADLTEVTTNEPGDGGID